ncbi:unnamed protein product [Adineta ricciae]|uniref:ADP-ribosylglycohydrolase n=1 Tax=Adineta ricciae TaxID=249248 RepID=A0A815Z493_ADIRI|nr:unnamed protein product [Adineta ricciae]
MTRYLVAHINNDQKDKPILTLPQLLNTDQPYRDLKYLYDPELDVHDNDIIRRIQGSLVGLAIGDAVGAAVEFRPYEYLKEHPVVDMQSGGTWDLQAGQWTDDTSMALCLAASLIIRGKSNSYDQFARYKRWYRNGYLSSTGKCFDIGKSTRQAIEEFENRQRQVISLKMQQNFSSNSSFALADDLMEYYYQQYGFDIKCGTVDSAGNGALMRLAPIPLFYFKSYDSVRQYIEESTRLTHGDQRAIDACQFYAGLIWHAINGFTKKQLLHPNFYQEHLHIPLHKDVLEIARGSYKQKTGYEDGIRGRGYVLESLEAALWAFYNDGDSFERGALAAVNIGDDTDTTAAIYGELAGAVYGIHKLPERWLKKLFERKFIMTVAKGLYVYGKKHDNGQQRSEGTERRSQLNLSAFRRDTRRISDSYMIFPEQDTYRSGTIYYDHNTGSATAVYNRQFAHPDTLSYRYQPSQMSSPIYSRRSGNSTGTYQNGLPPTITNPFNQRQLTYVDNTLRQVTYDNSTTTLQSSKPPIKVISEH